MSIMLTFWKRMLGLHELWQDPNVFHGIVLYVSGDLSLTILFTGRVK